MLQLCPHTRSTQQVACALCQQSPLRGLDEEIGGTGFIGARNRAFIVQAGEHQYRHVGSQWLLAQGHAGVESVHARHQGIEQYTVAVMGCKHGEGFAPAAGLQHTEGMLFEYCGGQQTGDRIVINQKNSVLLGGMVHDASSNDGDCVTREDRATICALAGLPVGVASAVTASITRAYWLSASGRQARAAVG